MNTKDTVKRALAAAAVVAVAAVAAVSVAAAPAQAYCRGNGSTAETGFLRIYNGHVIAREKANPGTCDSDGVYIGYVRDTYEDGYAVRIRYRDGSFDGVVHWIGYDYWSDYYWSDKNGNHSADFQLYSNPANRGYWHSTWGY